MRGPALFARLAGTYMATVIFLVRTETEETIIEALADDFGNLHLFGLGMVGI